MPLDSILEVNISNCIHTHTYCALVLYRNTKAGDLLTESHPETFKAMTTWNKSLDSFMEQVVNNIKMSKTGGLESLLKFEYVLINKSFIILICDMN